MNTIVKLHIAVIGLAVAGLLATGSVEASHEADFLGSLTFTVGTGTDQHGFAATYGTLHSGEFPKELFDDDDARSVAKVYEDTDGNWHLEYAAGGAGEWLSDQEARDAITVTVLYEDRVDTRRFVFGGFIVGTEGTRGLELNPPLGPEPIPSTDWSSHVGEEVIMEFHRHRGEDIRLLPSAETEPVAAADSFVDFLSSTTPGGAVMAQTLIVIIVFTMFIFTAPQTAWGIGLSAVVLILTPWVPVLWGLWLDHGGLDSATQRRVRGIHLQGHIRQNGGLMNSIFVAAHWTEWM